MRLNEQTQDNEFRSYCAFQRFGSAGDDEFVIRPTEQHSETKKQKT
jgi:hypothetical protein